MSRFRELRARREELIARSEAHREGIARCVLAWQRPLERVDGVLDVARGVKRHALWIAAGVAAVVVARGKINNLIGGARELARTARAVRGAISEIRGPGPL